MTAKEKYIALCPACSARLPMNDSHMEIADGNIRCGKCNTAFYAPEHLLRGFYSPDEQETTQSHLTDNEFFPFELADQDAQYDYEEKPSQPEPSIAKKISIPPIEDSYEEPYEQLAPTKQDKILHFPSDDEQVVTQPDTRKPNKRRPRRPAPHKEKKTGSHKWLWVPAICILLVILGLQVLVVNVSSWSHNPLLRGVYSQVCAAGLCDLPVDLKPVSINIEIAGYKRLQSGNYEIKGLLTNWAYYGQRMPVIRLSFVDLTETEKFTKTLKPEDYLADYQKDKETLQSEERFDFSVTINDLVKEKKHLFPRMELLSY